MNVDQLIDVLSTNRIVPVAVLDDSADAPALGAALQAGGLGCVEVTFRSETAAAAISAMATDTGLLVGAGTVVRSDQVDVAVAAGARFLVSPGISPTVVARAQELGVPIVPGVATPSEIMAALALGIGVVKLFPAEPLGGVATLRALAAPFRAVRFIPTGGISATLLPRYLAEPSVLAVGGSWMVEPGLLAARDWGEVTTRTKAAVRVVKEATA